MSTTESHYVSIIIPCRDEERLIAKCLDSIIANDYPKDVLEVLVVDGMSDDRTRDIVVEYAKRFPFITMLDNPKKVQQSALNIGIRYASGDLIIRMDVHCTFVQTYISQCVRHLVTEDADCVGGSLITVPRDETFIGKAIAVAMSDRFGTGNSRFRIRYRDRDIKPIQADTVPYGCYRREVFDKVGLYNEDLSYSEDAEFHRRMRSHGCRIVFVPSITSYYHARSDLKSFWKHAFRNGMWAVLPTMYTGRIVVSPKHLAPLAFVGSVVILGIISLVLTYFWIPLMLLIGLYLVANMGFSAAVAIRERDARFLGIMTVVFATHHIGYGLGSLAGLLRIVASKSLRSVNTRESR